MLSFVRQVYSPEQGIIVYHSVQDGKLRPHSIQLIGTSAGSIEWDEDEDEDEE